MNENKPKLYNDDDFIDELQSRVESDGPFSDWNLFQMAYETEKTTMTPEFDGLKALDHLPNMSFLEHQIDCCKQVLEDMNGRAILADEVGLGKTIEAGLIMKEYMIRGLAKKILILVPASLVSQWRDELNEKFYIPAITKPKRDQDAWEYYDILISSIDTAKRSPNKEKILNIDYDLLLIDEAHKLKNRKTQNYSFVRQITKKYCLLLTATPVQNRLMEIFNLVAILKPGHLGNYEAFLDTYGNNRKQIKQDTYLKQLIQKVMIRNTREDTTLNNAKRRIETIWIDMKQEERKIYDQVDSMGGMLPTFTKITLLREFCSSREACYLSLKKMHFSDDAKTFADAILEQIEQLPQHSKAEKMLDVIKKIGDEKIIVFTEYRATQLYLQWFLQEHGITSVPYRGGFKSSRKDWMRHLFENHAQVLIATEAGGEGINLQFCNHLINYDLPWNPMRLEQRIGRIHRFGQNKDVFIYNISIKNTFEEHIMTLLYEKIAMFENVIGNLDDILSELHLTDMETEMNRIFSESSSQGEIKVKMNNLTSVIQNAHNRIDKEDESYGN